MATDKSHALGTFQRTPKTLHMEVTKSGSTKSDQNVLFGILSLPAEMTAPWTLVSRLCQHCLRGSSQTTHTQIHIVTLVSHLLWGLKWIFWLEKIGFFWQRSSKIFFSKLKIVLQRHTYHHQSNEKKKKKKANRPMFHSRDSRMFHSISTPGK